MSASRDALQPPLQEETAAAFEAAVLRKVAWRLIPFMGLLYLVNYIDRINVGFAALTMNRDLALSPSVYGNGAGILFIGYFLFQIPCSAALVKFGIQRVVMPIMIVWGIFSAAVAFVTGPTSFYVMRFILGVAEAGFLPGMVLYLTYWFPLTMRGRVAGAFMLSIPLSNVIGAPVSTALLDLHGLGLKGWQWLFILQGLPPVFLGLLVRRVLTDRPMNATWLKPDEKNWLESVLAAERQPAGETQQTVTWSALRSPRVWMFGVMYFGIVIGFYGLTLWLPQILASFGGLTNMQVGLLTAVPYVFAALGMYFWGAHSDKTGERTWHLVLSCLVGGMALAASAYLIDEPRLAYIGLVFAAVGTYTAVPVFWTLPMSYLIGATAAGSIALTNAMGSLGGYFGPTIMGVVRQATHSYAYGLWVLASFPLLAAILAFIDGRRHART